MPELGSIQNAVFAIVLIRCVASQMHVQYIASAGLNKCCVNFSKPPFDATTAAESGFEVQAQSCK